MVLMFHIFRNHEYGDKNLSQLRNLRCMAKVMNLVVPLLSRFVQLVMTFWGQCFERSNVIYSLRCENKNNQLCLTLHSLEISVIFYYGEWLQGRARSGQFGSSRNLSHRVREAELLYPSLKVGRASH